VVFMLIVVVGGGLILLAATASAQTAGNTTTPTPAGDGGERIEQGFTLVNSSYSADTGTAELTLRTDSTRAVTLTDAGAFYKGGEMTRRTVILESGTHTVELPVTKTPGGSVGVTIATSETLYAEPIKVGQSSWFSGRPTWATVRNASFAAGAGVLLALAFEA